MVKVIKHEGRMVAIIMKEVKSAACLGIDFFLVENRHSDDACDELVGWKDSKELYRKLMAVVLGYCEEKNILKISSVTSDDRRARVYEWLAKKSGAFFYAQAVCDSLFDSVSLYIKSENVCWLEKRFPI